MHDIFDVLPDDILKTLVEETDEFAIKNVQSGKGGPFGASVHVYDLVSGDLTMIGDLEANAVIDKGMGSAHAEDQAMNPETVNALKSYLESLSKHSDAVVIFSSSGESCPACHSKEEILNRHLIDEGLLKSGRFAVTYGATYADTANIAGFNDEPYHRDMQKPKGSGMISIDRDNIINIPDEVRQIFEQSDVPVSVIALPDGRFIAGYEDRDADLMATSEVSAIRAATQKLRADGIVESWVLGGASRAFGLCGVSMGGCNAMDCCGSFNGQKMGNTGGARYFK